jgi:hypothetical protein
MPALGSLLDTTMRKLGGLYGVVPAISDGAALGAVSLQKEHLSAYPVQFFTPGGVALSNANIAQSIRNAYAYVQGTHTGGNIVIPRGDWHMGASGGLDLHGNGDFNAGIVLKGAANGCTTLIFPAPWTGEMLRLRGSSQVDNSTPPFPWRQGGVEDLNFFVDVTDVASNGKGIVIDACTNVMFKNIVVQNLTGGDSWACDDYSAEGGNNSQYCTFVNCAGRGGRINWNLKQLSASQFVNIDSRYTQYRDMLIDECNCIAIYGGAIQSVGLAALVEFGPNGGTNIVFEDIYHEGGGVTFFKAVAASSAQSIVVKRLIMAGAFTLFADITDGTDLLVDRVNGAGNATTFLKARGSGAFSAPASRILHCGSIHRDPAKFDMDAVSLAKLHCLDSGDGHFGSHVSTGSVSTAAYAEGAEPASPVAGTRVFNSGTNRPRIYTGSAWRDVAYADDPAGIVALIKPYAAAILDPRVYRNRSVISGELDTIKDLAHGATASAFSSSRRPTWNASDDAFAGAPSFACVNSSDKAMSITLASPIPIGSRPGALIVGRLTGSIPSSGRRRIFNCDASQFTLFGQDGDTGDAWAFCHAHTNQSTFSHFSDAGPHMLMANDDFDGANYFWRGTIDTTDGARLVNSDTGVSTAAINTVYIGAFSAIAGANSADYTFAFFAILHTPLPPSVKARVLELVNAEWRLGL